MSFKILIATGALAVLAGGLVLYVLLGQDNYRDTPSLPADTTEPATTTANLPSESGQATLLSLLRRGNNLECMITYETDSISPQVVEGTYFTSEGRLRGDFLLAGDTDTESSVSSMILRDDVLYHWTEIMGQKYGLQVDIKDLLGQGSTTLALPDTREPVPLQAVINYDCKGWSEVDGSIFQPPTDIIFTDYAASISSGMDYGAVYDEATTNMSDNPCDLCRQVVGSEAMAECLANFSCQAN